MRKLTTELATVFKNDWKILLIFSFPAVLLGGFGLSQLNILNAGNLFSLSVLKWMGEFLFLGLCLSLLQLVGIKNKFVLTVIAFFYYWTVIADAVLLLYFRERFGAKYVNTLQGGDYAFLTDWRVLTCFALLFLFCAIIIWKFFTPSSRKTALKRTTWCISGLVLLWGASYLLPFYHSYLLPPSLVYTGRALFAKKPTPIFSAETIPLAKQYNVFSAQQTPVGKNYKRVILIASESLSNKYLHHFNPNIPAEASKELDQLFENNPSASLKHVSLSTLYGLTVIFTSHPYAQLSFENKYPISLVKELKKKGYETAFLRGANETYMDENILFQNAGFDKIIGATYFQTREDYKKYLNWWGLLDRKLFDYAVEFLKEKKQNPVFLTLLTVDTHVPLGRLDYLGETYREIDHKFYDVPTLPRAFGRFGQDVQRFLNKLEESGLWDEDTLLLVMPDHPSYSNTPTDALFKPFLPEFDNLPFIIVTKNRITAPLTDNVLASQLDIAPTILDLLNLEIPRGMFGHSLFDLNAQRSVFDIKEDYAVITSEDGQKVIPLNSSRSTDKPLLDLMRTFYLPQ